MEQAMKLHIEITAEQAKELLAEATDGMASPLREYLEAKDTLRRILIRNAILRRLP
jgi:hypothetical protein